MSWIRTATGRHLNLTGSTAADIDPLDLARGLARACRFAGQCDAFYSVAQHSVLASFHVPPQDALHALLHDAAEAYLGDLTGPLKRLLVSYHQAMLASAAQVAGLTPTDFIEQLTHRLPLNWTVPYTQNTMALQADQPFYHQLEQHLMGLIAERFGLSTEMPDSVKAIDLRLLATERRDFMPADDEPWECLVGIEPLPTVIEPWPAVIAERRFLERLHELTSPSSQPQSNAQQGGHAPPWNRCIADSSGGPAAMSQKLSEQLLKDALAYAIKQTISQDGVSERRAWLTRFGVYALYPAICPAMLSFLQRDVASADLPSQQGLLDQLIEIEAIPSPRGFGVRQTRSICESILNVVLEVKVEYVWGVGEEIPEQWHITTAMGHWYQWVADQVGLPSTPVDQQRLYLHTLRPRLTEPLEAAPASANPDVVLAIYWPATDFELDLDTRSIPS